MTLVDQLLEQLVGDAQQNPDVLGLVLVSSRCKGFAALFSDYDAYLVVHQDAVENSELGSV